MARPSKTNGTPRGGVVMTADPRAGSPARARAQARTPELRLAACSGRRTTARAQPLTSSGSIAARRLSADRKRQPGDGAPQRPLPLDDPGLTCSGCAARAWGENIGWTTGDIADLQRAFMRSPVHRENILDGRFRRVAVGAAKDDRGSCGSPCSST